jgi:hypothetical protein
MSETHEHLEHAEHAAHGADPFTMRVAMSMAIIAAVLAAISLVGHRKHNEALQNQGDSNRLNTESAAFEVKSSNTFSFYQAKRARVEIREIAISQNVIADERAGLDPAKKDKNSKGTAIVAKWLDYNKKNESKEEEVKVDSQGFPVKDAKGEEDNSPGALIIRGKKYTALADERSKKSKE